MKFKIKEKFEEYGMNRGHSIPIFKNPNAEDLEEEKNGWNRGFITPKGDLFMAGSAEGGYTIIHFDFIRLLYTLKKIPVEPFDIFNSEYGLTEESFDMGLAVTRKEKSNIFTLSDSYDVAYFGDRKKIKKIEAIFAEAKEKSQLPMGLRPIGLSSDAQRKS